MHLVCQFQGFLGQGLQICRQNCKFSRVHVASVARAPKNQRDFMKNACCMSILGFFGPRISNLSSKLQIFARARRKRQKPKRLYEKCMLYVYSRVFWVKDFKFVVKIAIFKIKKLSGKKLQSESFTFTNLFHVLSCFSIVIFILDSFPKECILMI